MIYHSYEFIRAALNPLREAASATQLAASNPLNPFSYSYPARSLSASCALFRDLTHRSNKPEFGLHETSVNGAQVTVTERIVASKAFGDLLHFERDPAALRGRDDPRVLLVAPLSGHHATLLRGTVQAMLPGHDTYITDWRDARCVSLGKGHFDLNDYIDYLMAFIRHLGPRTHVVAVCQPTVAALAATALMAAKDDPCQPASLTLMSGPIDPRRNPTAVNHHAQSHDIAWFKHNVISLVPPPNPGWMRMVYPGFMQLGGFMSMNLGRHVDAYSDYFLNLVAGDHDSVMQHRKFYDEFLSVMDLPSEFFLQTLEEVFQKHALAQGSFVHRGERVRCDAITKTALMTVEGERDDICAVGQTEAAHDLCPNVAKNERYHHVQPGVGHYGVFNGTRWCSEIQPRIAEMIRTVERRRKAKLNRGLT